MLQSINLQKQAESSAQISSPQISSAQINLSLGSAGFLLGFPLHRKDRGDIFPRNFGHSPNYSTLEHRTPKSSREF
jgi:hypothetical protein